MSEAEVDLNRLFQLLEIDLTTHSESDSHSGIAAKRQLARMRKKALMGDTDRLAAKAIQDFLDCNEQMRTRTLSLPENIIVEASDLIRFALEKYTTSVTGSVQESLCYDHLINDLWRFGPGASNGIQGSHACQKVYQAFTCTRSAESLVSTLRKNNPYFEAFDSSGNGGTTLVSGSRLETVPKNEDTNRTIAIEPLGNMALQLAAGRYLEMALSGIGLDITKQQPLNKAAAQRGSVTGCLATVDLKQASDRISPALVRSLMPREWYILLMRLRSPVIELPSGTSVELNMISTMGNGFTFPLMTLLLVALIYAYNRVNGGKRHYIDWRNHCVFGDDIIVPTRDYARLCRTLEQAGFVVNHDKSFCQGPFRESCGGDFYEGYDVTPFYIKSITTVQERYIVLNQILSWAAKHKFTCFNALRYIWQSLQGKVLLVPEWHNPDEGVLTSGCPRRYKYLRSKLIPKRHVSGVFDMMLCLGGYLTQGEQGDLMFTPRSARAQVKVKQSRLPSGFLDGWCAEKRSAEHTSWVNLLINLM